MKSPRTTRTFHNKAIQLLSLLTCFLMLMAVSVVRDGKVLGHSLKNEPAVAKASSDTLRTTADGTIIINTTYLAKDVTGFGGNVPLEVYVKDGRIVNIKALPNHESPEFFGLASSLFSQWKGKTLDGAAAQKVDGVSGATFSSKAIIANMQRAIAYAQKSAANDHWYSRLDLSAKSLVALLVALMAAIIPLFYKNKTWRVIQQILNVGVLGFWCGSFVSYANLISFTSNGLDVLAMPVATVLLIVAFVYPLFGQRSYYCANVCPFGSLQEIVGHCVPYKVKMQPKTVRRLDVFRQVLWAVLMFCLWTGVWFGWVDYEPFSAFILQSASWAVIVLAGCFIVLSAVVPRPYCRFVCPTGTLLRMSQSSSSK